MGILQSLTGEETARLSLNGIERRQTVEPMASYIAARVQKDWNKGNTIVGGMFTSTDRAIGDSGLTMLPQHAITAGVDVVRFFSNRSYVVEGKTTFSRVAGDRAAIAALQYNPVHYFQRSDATHLSVDPTATSLAGHGGTMRVARYGNSKWRASNTLRWVSPGLELNDIGYLRQADFISDETVLGFEQTEPRGAVRSYGINVERSDSWDFGGLHSDGAWTVEGEAQFANKWRISAGTHFIDTTIDTRLLRGGPAFAMQRFLSTSLSGSTDPSRRAVVTLGTHRHTGPTGAVRQAAVSSGLRFRLSRAISVAADAYYESLTDDVQYVDTVRPDGDARYLLGRLDQRTVGVTVRADLHLTPDLSVQFYGSPFVSNGRYAAFKRVTDPRAPAYDERFYLFDPGELQYDAATNRYTVAEGGATYGFQNPDFSIREFRSNLVTRWEFRPGSTFYLVWSQDRRGAGDTPASLGHGFDALRREPATNVLLAKDQLLAAALEGRERGSGCRVPGSTLGSGFRVGSGSREVRVPGSGWVPGSGPLDGTRRTRTWNRNPPRNPELGTRNRRDPPSGTIPRASFDRSNAPVTRTGTDDFPLPRRQEDWRRGNGRSLPGRGPHARPPRRAQSAVARLRVGSGQARAVPARGPSGRRSEPPTHRHHLLG